MYAAVTPWRAQRIFNCKTYFVPDQRSLQKAQRYTTERIFRILFHCSHVKKQRPNLLQLIVTKLLQKVCRDRNDRYTLCPKYTSTFSEPQDEPASYLIPLNCANHFIFDHQKYRSIIEKPFWSQFWAQKSASDKNMQPGVADVLVKSIWTGKAVDIPKGHREWGSRYNMLANHPWWGTPKSYVSMIFYFMSQ